MWPRPAPACSLLRHRQRGAHLVGDGGADILHAGLVDLDDLREQRHALLAAGLRKGLEGAPGGGHRLVDVGLGAERNLIHRLFGRRVDDGRGLLDDRIDPGAVDVELHAVDHRKPLDFGANGRGTERSASILARNLRKMNPPYAGRRIAADATYKISVVKEARRPAAFQSVVVPANDVTHTPRILVQAMWPSATINSRDYRSRRSPGRQVTPPSCGAAPAHRR